MSVFVLDTDILSLWQHGHSVVTSRAATHSADELATTVITVQEQLDGWHARLPRAKERKHIAALYQRLADTVRFLSRVNILPYSEEAIDRYELLRKLKLNIAKMDPRIAAIALEFDVTLVTRNIQDFCRVPGLKIEDWSK
jgi:tRNA(fMet)-specific endonuclease VapC